MPAIEVIRHDELTKPLRREIVALCTDAYEEDFGPDFQRLAGATHVLAIESGRVVSHAAWVPRVLRLGSGRRALECAYVEAVATPVALQRRGLGTVVLRALPPLLDAFDLAALSPSEPAFYARSGWETWLGKLYHLEAGRRVPSGDEAVMIHRLPRTPADLDLADELEAEWREGDVW